jgi:hypothetical protein
MTTSSADGQSLPLNPAESAYFARIIFQNSPAVELRALGVATAGGNHCVLSGYYNSPDHLGWAASQITLAKGLYITFNTLRPNVAQPFNELRAAMRDQRLTTDADVVARHWLPLDLDPVRQPGTSSTNAEHDLALARARDVFDALTADGFPSPIVIDTGNGACLICPICLPNDFQSGELLRNVLEGLAFRFDDDRVRVDRQVFNASRLVRLPGTINRKGENSLERPHRLARLLHVPPVLTGTQRDLLEKIANTSPRPAFASSKESNGGCDIEQWIHKFMLEVNGPAPWRDGRKWILQNCPWNENHRKSAYILQFANGAIAAGCLHKSCSDKHWPDLRDQYETGWRKSNRSENMAHRKVSIPWPVPIAEAAFIGPIGEVVRAIEPRSEADPAGLLVQSLAAFGNVIGHEVHFQAEADRHALNLFVVLVGVSAKGRKGTSWGHIRR